MKSIFYPKFKLRDCKCLHLLIDFKMISNPSSDNPVSLWNYILNYVNLTIKRIPYKKSSSNFFAFVNLDIPWDKCLKESVSNLLWLEF